MDGSAYQDEADLKRQLDSLLALARDNEDKLRRFNALELQLIAAASLRELIEHILVQLPAVFGLDHATLTLVAPHDEFVRLLEEGGLTREELGQIHVTSAGEALAAFYGPKFAPILGDFDPSRHALFFPGQRTLPASVALLPLRRGNELIGSLNLGCLRANRFPSDSSTDFLERLGAIVAVCLENGANHERLKQLGLTDPLTGVNNRRYFEERLSEEFAAAQRSGQPLACMFVDADRFKLLNDEYGHQAGDNILRQLARLIRAQLRRSDVVCRYGGEEFVVLMPNTTDQSAYETAERMRQRIERHEFVHDGMDPVCVTLSTGIAVLNSGDERPGSPEDLLRRADEAVYCAKALGRNRVVVAGDPGAGAPDEADVQTE